MSKHCNGIFAFVMLTSTALGVALLTEHYLLTLIGFMLAVVIFAVYLMGEGDFRDKPSQRSRAR